MLFNLERPLETTILIYLIVLGILFMTKPKFLFDPKGNMKQFATGAGNIRTILPLCLNNYIFNWYCYILYCNCL